MSGTLEIPVTDWDGVATPALRDMAQGALEGGEVLVMPHLPFLLNPEEQALLGATGSSAKNISWDAARGVRGNGPGDDRSALESMMSRYSAYTRKLLDALLPSYGSLLQAWHTSFRPVEISGRETSWRKDDKRLHVDSFPASPLQGRRILRVFTNVNDEQLPRVWKLGAPFEDVAQRYVSSIRKPVAGSAALMQALHLTKSRRSVYDHYMLHIHDGMKADLNYQAKVPQTLHEFAAGSTWMVYTDQVSHAALSGRHALEQTYLLPVEAMGHPSTSPLAVLERLLGTKMV